MKLIKKLSIAVVALAMCLLLGVTVFAVDSTEVIYSAEFDKEPLCVSDSTQKIKLTVTTNTNVEFTSFDALVTVPEGWKITGVTSDWFSVEKMICDKRVISDREWRIVCYHDEVNNVTTNKLAEIEIEIPAEATAEAYTIDFAINDIARAVYEGDVLQDIATWVEDKDITVDFSLIDHSFTTKPSGSIASEADCENAAQYYVQCDNCDVVSADKKVSVGEAKGHAYPATPSSYTDNKDGTHTANYVCGNDATHTRSDAPVEHTYNQENDTKCVCGAVKPVTNVSVTYKGAALANAYTVEGQVVTVTFASACKIGYWDATNNKYVAIAAVANPDGSYSFTIPAGITEVLLVVKGDANTDGSITMADATRTRAAYNSKITLNAEQQFAANVNTDDTVTIADATRIRAAFNNKVVLTWG